MRSNETNRGDAQSPEYQSNAERPAPKLCPHVFNNEDEEIGAKLKKLEEEFNLQGYNGPDTLEEKLATFENR